MSRRASTIVPAILALLGTASNSLAAGPSLSTAPELGPKKAPEDILHCERHYLYRGKRLACDSALAADGERLRPLLESVPEAKSELDRYQENRRSLKITAYTGMAGLIVAALAPRFMEQSGTRNVTVALGLSLTLGSFAFGRSRLAANEIHLQRAVRHYNEARTDDPIALLEPGASTPPDTPKPKNPGG